MNKVVIFTDSTSDLTKEILEERNIKIIPFTVTIGAKSYTDGEDINTKELIEICDATKEIPKTAMPSIALFEERMMPYINDGYDVLYVGIGKELSGSYNNLSQVEKIFPVDRFIYYDGMNLSSATGLQVLNACDLRDQGKSAKEIKENLEKRAPNFFSNFTVFSLDYLKKGGRVSSFKAFIGSILRVKPILGVRGGFLTVRESVFGNFKKGLDFQLNEIEWHFKNNNLLLDYITITHVHSEEAAAYMKEELAKRGIVPKHLYDTIAGCTIASHCGAKTIGVLYEVKDSSLDYLKAIKK